MVETAFTHVQFFRQLFQRQCGIIEPRLRRFSHLLQRTKSDVFFYGTNRHHLPYGSGRRFIRVPRKTIRRPIVPIGFVALFHQKRKLFQSVFRPHDGKKIGNRLLALDIDDKSPAPSDRLCKEFLSVQKSPKILRRLLFGKYKFEVITRPAPVRGKNTAPAAQKGSFNIGEGALSVRNRFLSDSPGKFPVPFHEPQGIQDLSGIFARKLEYELPAPAHSVHGSAGHGELLLKFALEKRGKKLCDVFRFAYNGERRYPLPHRKETARAHESGQSRPSCRSARYSARYDFPFDIRSKIHFLLLSVSLNACCVS